MSILFRGHEARNADSLAETLAANRGGVPYRGGPVGSDQALRLGAVWSCIDLICRLAALPVSQYSKTPDGAPIEVAPSALLTSPSPTVSPIGWRRQIYMSWLTRGNLFGAVTARSPLMYPTGAEILDPNRLSARRAREGAPVEWLVDGKSLGPDLLHWPAFTVPGSSIGLSPLEYASRMIGLGLSAGQFGAQWFDDGAHPSSVLTTDKPVDAEQAATIKARFLAAIRGREPAVLGLGMKYESIQIAPNESQFLETIKANKADVAGFFLVPPEMIGGESGNSMTYANIEQRSLGYLTWNAGWWITLLEEFLSAQVPPAEYVKINTGALVKVDLKTQAEVETLRIRGGWGKPDEARAHEERPPLPAGEGERTVWPPYSSSAPAAKSDPDPAADAERLAQTIQKIYVVVGKVVTTDEARSILNQAGASLTGPGPEGQGGPSA